MPCMQHCLCLCNIAKREPCLGAQDEDLGTNDDDLSSSGREGSGALRRDPLLSDGSEDIGDDLAAADGDDTEEGSDNEEGSSMLEDSSDSAQSDEYGEGEDGEDRADKSLLAVEKKARALDKAR